MTQPINVNGRSAAVDVDADTPVLWILRDVLGLTSTNVGCGLGLCGACTVHVDGAPTRSCITPIDSVVSKRVDTIEHLSASRIGRALQRAWLELDVVLSGRDSRAAPPRPPHAKERT
jgi:isoquinoline 1-oxidoreductase alpha subunit